LKQYKKEYRDLLDIPCAFKENPKETTPIEPYYNNTMELRYLN
jgi:hypothetical protein